MVKKILNWKPATTLNSFPERETYRDNARVFAKKTRELMHSSQPTLTSNGFLNAKHEKTKGSSGSLLVIDNVLRQGALDCMQLECMLSDPIIYKSRDKEEHLDPDVVPTETSKSSIPSSLPDIQLNSPILLYQPTRFRNKTAHSLETLTLLKDTFPPIKDRSAFYKDHDKLMKIQHLKILNLASGMTKDLSLYKSSLNEFLSVGDTLSMLWNAFVYILSLHHDLLDETVANELIYSTKENQGLVKLKTCLMNLSKNRFVGLKTVLGHLYRLVQSYGDINLLTGICNSFGSLIMESKTQESFYLWNEWTLQGLYCKIFLESICMKIQDAALYNMILHYHELFERSD